MNKEITIYELLGLIKDGQDVGKFWWNGCIHEVDEYNKIYDTYCRKYKELTLDCLNDKVKIIEEDNKIEKLDNRYYDEVNECYGGKKELGEDILIDKINELIDEINYIRSNK